MLIAFEGQDGAGKTALLRATYTELTRRGMPAITVAEFSDGPYGQRLVEALSRDKFLRPMPGEPATTLIRTLEIVADLYYLDERVIRPACDAGYVVLKERHVDTIFSTQVPALVRPGLMKTASDVLAWLATVLNQLHYRPSVTVYVDATLDIRIERIKKRTSDFDEHRARKVSRDDLAVFAAREQVMRWLMAAEPARFVTIDNNRPLADGMAQVLGLIHAWRTAAK
jgi:thymidylate kinase